MLLEVLIKAIEVFIKAQKFGRNAITDLIAISQNPILTSKFISIIICYFANKYDQNMAF